MSRAFEIIRGILILLAALSLLVWLGWRTLKRADDPARLILKWIVSAAILTAAFFAIGSMARGGDPSGQIAGLLLGLVFGLTLWIIWRESLAEMIAKPFGSLYDGGDIPPEPVPFYSIAQARRKQGRFQDAIYEIQTQLTRFPNDVTGQLLMAEIQAENLNDLSGAQLTIERFCQQPGHPPKHLANALCLLADLHLKRAQDRDAARQALEKIIALVPGTEEAQLASQRIAHLASADYLLAAHDRPSVILKHGVEDLGLRTGPPGVRRPEATPAEQAAALVAHLEEHPLDSHAREHLARIYFDQYQRLDLAADQLEQLIQFPNQPAKDVVRWLNLLADLQVKQGCALADVQHTLQRIIELNPNLAAAENARQRLAHLKLEFRKNEKGQTVQLGAYPKDMGLKHKAQPK